MNDTNLNDRQKQILSILKQKSNIVRQELTKKISTKKGISRITIIRDLNDLINKRLIKVEGKGKNTRYGLLEMNSLLTYLDLDGYFIEEDRIIKKSFDASVFDQMIAYIQPFADGNKRTSRMLSNAVLMAYNFPSLSYRSINVNEYRSAMIVFYETNNLYNFKRLYLKQLQYVIENYFQ